MYDCPIKTFFTASPIEMRENYQGLVVQAVQKVGIDVDKEELIKAIQNDRERYEAAYQKGWNACEAQYTGMLNKIVQIASGKDDVDE